MVSNALSTRRKFLRRPKVCKTLPNPGRCEPPPPPPPDWPPDTFLLRWIASWYGGAFDTEILFTRVGEDYYWLGRDPPWPNVPGGSWLARTDDHLGELILHYSPKGLVVAAAKTDIPITWGTETLYDITEWDTVVPDDLTSEAIFLF